MSAYIDLQGIELTMEMRQWINTEPIFYKWKFGDKLPRNGMWKQARERLGIYLDEHDAIVFRLKFGLVSVNDYEN